MKKLTALPIFLLILLTSFSAQSQIVFSHEYGGIGNEDGRWMEQLPDSGFILTGITDTYSNGQADCWLVRTDAYGNVMWTKSIGSTEFDFANMVKLTRDGGFIIAGFTNRNNGTNDGWLVKTDANGVMQWEKFYGVGGLQEFEAVVQTSDGGYAALGVNYTTGTQYYDFYLVKVDSSGNVQWEKNIGGQGYEIGNSLHQTADGGFILAGQSYSYAGLDGDFYMVKTDASGNVQWWKNYANPGIQEAHYVQIVPSGGYILIGDADDLPNSLGSTDVWLIRTNNTGDTLWTRTFGGSKKDGGKTIENTSDGGFIAAGITRSFGLINPNYYLFKTDSTGNLEWSNYSYGSTYHDHAYRAIQTSDGGYAEFGYFKSAANKMNFALVKLGPNGGVTKDVAVDNVNYPAASICQGYNVPISITLTNYGSTNENNIPVAVAINNGSTTTVLRDTLRTSLAPSFSSTVVFSQTYNFATPGTYELTAYIVHRPNDQSFSNDTSYLTIEVLAPTYNPTTNSGISCTAGTVALSAAAASSADSLFWFDAPTGNNLVATGTSFTTPSLNSTTNYYVEAQRGKGSKVGPVDNTIGGGSTTNTGYLKFDSRINFKLVSVKVYATSTGNRIIELRNSAGTVLASKTVNLPVGESRVFLNFDVPPGNDFQLGLNASSATLFRNSSGVAYPYSVSRTVEIYGSSGGANNYYYFYDWYVFVPYQNCSSNRVLASAQIGSSASNAFDRARCGTGTLTLTASSSQSLQWYDAASGGNLLGSGTSFTTPSISSTTTYYLQVGSCSTRVAVQAIVNTTSAAPSASNVSRCGPGTVALSATASDPIFWYDAASNGNLVGTGTSFTTPYLNSTTNYYAIAGTSCPSNPVTVSAIINSVAPPTVTGASACGPASVTLTASSVNPIEWYDAPSGGTLIATGSSFTTPVLASTVTYYAQATGSCPSPRVAVDATITIVDPPAAGNAARCGAGSVVLSAASTDPVTWWSASSGGTQLSSGINFTTPVLNATTTYYAQASSNGCTSQRVAVVATINITAPPVVTSGSHCGPGNVVLTASSPDSISWYDGPSGGNLLGTGSSYTTPVINSTTTYYAQAGLTCLSVRVAVNAVIATTSTDPTVTPATRCGTGTLTLSASSPDPISWYDAPNGNLLGSGSSFTTPSISTSTTYYAVAGIQGCFSNFIPVTAQVNPRPAAPVVSGAQKCGPSTLTLTASGSNPITWYDSPSGGNVVTTGSSYTAFFNSTTTYYVETFDGTCSSLRIPVEATVYPLPVVNLGPDTLTIASGQVITLNAGAGFSSYLWSTGATTATISTGAAGVYYVSVTDGNNCQGADTIVINIITGIDAANAADLLVVYPNPSNGIFQMVIDQALADFEIKIFNNIGKVVAEDRQSNTSFYQRNFDLREQAAGLYILKFTTANKSITRMLIIE